MDVREPDAFACGPVRIRRGDGPGAVAGEIAESEVVGVDDDDVGFRGAGRRGRACQQQAAGADAGAAGAQSAPGDDGVVDADFTEVDDDKK